MRDVVVLALIFGSLLFAFRRPWLGILIWSWIGYMNPHRLCYGFALNFPVAALTAAVVVASVLLNRRFRPLPKSREVLVLLLFIGWMTFTSLFALNGEGVWEGWSRMIKVQFMVFMTLLLMRDRRLLNAMMWTIVLSLGFYGVKLGMFAAATGGHTRILGPSGTYIEGNNEIALALVIALPLMRYLQLQSARRWVRRSLGLAMALTATAVLASYSRAGLLALATVACLVFIKSRRKLMLGAGMAVAAPLLLLLMPEAWFERMRTIQSYQEDTSALGRINAWKFACNIARDRPLVGGGFGVFTPQLFLEHAPDPEDYHDAHSIYFKVLGEHGVPGLLLFGLLFFLAWRSGSWVIRQTRAAPEMRWAGDMCAMTQVSVAGYAVGGAFAGLSYFDLPYHLLCFLILAKLLVREQAVESAEPAAETARARNLEIPTPVMGRLGYES